MYDIIFSDIALKQFKKFERKTQEQIQNGLEKIKIRPQAYVTKLVGEDYYRLRTGDYRIILEIKNEQLIIFVIKMGHRKSIYE